MVLFSRSLENGRLVKGETRLVGASRVFYVYLHRTPLERVVHRLKHTSQRVSRPMQALLKVRAAPPKNSALCCVVTCAA